MTGRAEPLVGRCYTRARRLPLMIGRMPGSDTTILGGPYTLTQFVTGALALLVMWMSHPVWAHFGLLTNALIFLTIPVLLVWASRRARIEGRDPFKFVLGLAAFYRFPAGGSLAGRAIRPRPDQVLTPRRFWTTTPARAGSGDPDAVDSVDSVAEMPMPAGRS